MRSAEPVFIEKIGGTILISKGSGRRRISQLEKREEGLKSMPALERPSPSKYRMCPVALRGGFMLVVFDQPRVFSH
jgi:hypothetical protein